MRRDQSCLIFKYEGNVSIGKTHNSQLKDMSLKRTSIACVDDTSFNMNGEDYEVNKSNDRCM